MVFVIVNIIMQKFGLYICFLKKRNIGAKVCYKGVIFLHLIQLFNLYLKANDIYILVNWKEMLIVIMSKKSFFWTYVMNIFYEKFC